MRVLVVEDDKRLVDAICQGLREERFEVLRASTAAEARELLLFAAHDVIVLDVMLPRGSGFELCQLVRARGITTPVLMLTARDAVADRVRGLELGADDYLTKPFAFPELIARIRALARRPVGLAPEVVRVRDLKVDLRTRAVARGGRVIFLTAKEFALLENLTDVRQTKIDPLLLPVPGQGGRRTVDVWAPLEGRLVNAELRMPF